MLNLTEGSLDILRECEADARPSRNECIENECEHVAAGAPAAWAVRLNGLDDFCCEACFIANYQDNDACTLAWEADELEGIVKVEETRGGVLPPVSLCPFCPEWETIANDALAANQDLRLQLATAHKVVGALTEAIDELDSLGEWIWSEPDDKTVLSIYLTEAHHTELMDLMDSARAWFNSRACEPLRALLIGEAS